MSLTYRLISAVKHGEVKSEKEVKNFWDGFEIFARSHLQKFRTALNNWEIQEAVWFSESRRGGENPTVGKYQLGNRRSRSAKQEWRTFNE